MATIRAIFDGKVFVPDEPVDLPVGEAVDIALPVAKEDEPPLMSLVRLAESVRGEAGDGHPRDYAAQIDHYLYGVPKNPDNEPPTR